MATTRSLKCHGTFRSVGSAITRPHDGHSPFSERLGGLKNRAQSSHQGMAQAVVLRRGGASYDEIARALGYATRSGAWRAVDGALRGTLREEAGALRSLEGERLDRLQLAVWPAAMRGNCEAVRTILRISQRRAHLFGLDTPKRVEGAMALRSMAETVAEREGLDLDMILAEANRIINEAGY